VKRFSRDMPAMEQATVYGVSDAGFKLGRGLASAGYLVSMVDESLKTAVRLPESGERNLASLFGEDTLSPIAPLSGTIADSSVIVFAPKLRLSGAEARAEMLLRLKEVGQNMTRGCVLLNVVPFPPGGNRGALNVLEEQSGLKPGQEFTYIYLPESGRGDHAPAGLLGKAPPKKIWMAVGFPSVQMDVDSAELLFVQYMLRSYLDKAVQTATYRDLSVSFKPEKPIYVQDLSEGLYEVQMLTESLPQGDPLLHFAAGAMRSLSGYIKVLESFLRVQTRNKGLKAIRSKILVLWSIDQYEMKAERLRLLGLILSELREVFGEVQYWNPHDLESKERAQPPFADRYQVVVACSPHDLEEYVKARPSAGQLVVKACVPPEAL
jgi:hypothetical protein